VPGASGFMTLACSLSDEDEDVEDDLERLCLVRQEVRRNVQRPAAQTGVAQRRLRRMALLLGIMVAVLAGAACITRQQTLHHPIPKTEVGATVGLFSTLVTASLNWSRISSHWLQAFGVIGSGMEQARNIINDASTLQLQQELWRNFTQRLEALEGENLTDENDLDDGNVCPDGEEEFGGLCYRKCRELTDGRYPIRTTAFACCQAEPCNGLNSVFSNPLEFCHGLDVGGHRTGLRSVGCPHLPGDCLRNEQFHLGLCYKQCALLTAGEYPYRTGADTCCRFNSYLACADASSLLTNASLNVGGGVGDKLLEAKASQVHPPLLELTEHQASSS